MNGAKNINYNKTSAVPKDIIALVSYGRHVVLTNTMYICRWIWGFFCIISFPQNAADYIYAKGMLMWYAVMLSVYVFFSKTTKKFLGVRKLSKYM